MISFLSDKYPEIVLSDLYGSSILNFLETTILFSMVAVSQFTLPPAVHKDSLFFTSSSTLFISCFLISYSKRYEVIVHSGFELYFPDDN